MQNIKVQNLNNPYSIEIEYDKQGEISTLGLKYNTSEDNHQIIWLLKSLSDLEDLERVIQTTIKITKRREVQNG